MYKAHKIRIYPTPEQAASLGRAIGVARLAYNFAVSKWRGTAEGEKRPSANELSKLFNAEKKSLFSWMNEPSAQIFGKVTQWSIQQNFDKALQNCYSKRSKAPTFRSRSSSDTATVDNQAFKIKDKRLSFPNTPSIRMATPLRFENSKLVSCTISRSGKRWFAAVNVELVAAEQPPVHANPGSVIGVDLGLKTAVQLSTGEQYKFPVEALARKAKRLVRYSRSFARKCEAQRAQGQKLRSKRCLKVQEKIQHLHNDITNIRNDFWHKTTSDIASKFETVVIGDLNVKGMKALPTLGAKLQNVALGQFRPKLTYKILAASGKLIVADRWFASSKLCSECGEKNSSLKLGQSSWKCACGALHDRDLNAALNLRNLAVPVLPQVMGEVKTLESRKVEPRKRRSRDCEEVSTTERLIAA